MYLQGGVEHHQFGAGGDGVVAAVALHEVHVGQAVFSLRQRSWGHRLISTCIYLMHIIVNIHKYYNTLDQWVPDNFWESIP